MIGEIVSHYKITEKLGEGGMGEVYKAEDTKLKRTVALKFLPSSFSFDKEAKRRFLHEAQTASSLEHINICNIHEIGESEIGQLFISMACYEGETLKEKIEKGSLTIDETFDITFQICEGLNKAHENKIIHRDIKSANIFITKDKIVKILDFGLAKAKGQSQLTKMGTTIGTIAYMSPEQARGEEVDQRTDIWSLGIIMYEMVTGNLPFNADYEQAVIYSILNEEPDWNSFIGKNCPNALVDAIVKCLNKNKNLRYQSVSDLLDEIKTVRESSKEVFDTSLKRKTKKKNYKKKKFLIPAVIILLIFLLFILSPGRKYMASIFEPNPVSSEKHLLILPFTNIGGNPDNKAFCSGLMETLTSEITLLQQFHSSLWVIPVSEVLKNNIKSPGEANQVFGVNLAVTGSLQEIGKSFRLTLNLINAKNLRQLNSSVIDVKEKDLASLQNKSVISLLEMLNLNLNTKSIGMLEAGNTEVPEAYEYYVQGRGYLQNKENINDVETAINTFSLSIKTDSLYANAHSGLAQAYWFKYELTKKKEWAEKAVKEAEYAYMLNDKLTYVNIVLGTIHDGTGKYKDAIKDFNQALKNDPINYEANRGLAIAYEDEGSPKDAETTYKRVISLQPDNWIGYNDLGVFYYNNSRYDDAIPQFQKVIEINPNSYRGFSNLGVMYFSNNNLKKATEMFEKALNIKPSYEVASNLGTLYYSQGKYSKAAQSYEKALQINDYDYFLWGNLGSAYSLSGDSIKSENAYRKAIKLGEEAKKVNPNDAALLIDLSNYYSDVEDKKNSLKNLNKALELSPKDGYVMFHAGAAYKNFGDTAKAVDYYIKAIQNGYSRSEIESQPGIKKLLMTDARYREIIAKDSNMTKIK